MSMGVRSGLGRGLQQAGQQIFSAVLAKQGLDLDRRRLDLAQQQETRKYRELLARIGWKLGNDDVVNGTAPAIPAVPHKPITSPMKTWDPKAMAHRNRSLAAQYGWRMGFNDAQAATSGVAGGMAKPTGTVTAPTQPGTPAPTQPAPAAGPFRMPGMGMPRMGGSGMTPRLGPSPAAPQVGANDLRRRPDEEVYG